MDVWCYEMRSEMNIKESVKVTSAANKIHEKRLKWYRHARRIEGHMLRMADAVVPEKIRKARPDS